MKVINLQKDADLKEEVRRCFPHTNVRAYQADLANKLYETLQSRKITVIEAPTGLGKWLTRSRFLRIEEAGEF
jgi:superfamily II DNA or RNA helicase